LPIVTISGRPFAPEADRASISLANRGREPKKTPVPFDPVPFDPVAKYHSSLLVSNLRSASIRSLLRSPIHCHQNPPNGLNCYGFYLSRASAEFFDYTGGGIALFDFNRHHGHVIVKWLATTELTDRFQYLGDSVIDRERTRLIDHIANPGGLKLLIGRVG
jgi:hypothetical protein